MLSILIVRHWLLSTLFVLTLLVAYTESPLYGAEPTPTPNVSTVPKPGQVVTSTATPVPVVVIITQAAPTSVSPNPSSGSTTVSGTPTAPGNRDEAPSTNDNGNAVVDQPAGANNQPGKAPASVISTDSTRLILVVEPSQTLIWPGVLFQLHYVVSNRGDGVLNHLEIRQPLAAALDYHAQTIDQNGDQTGTLQIEGTPDQASVLVMRWPQLAPGAVVSRTVELHVKNDTPNGIFLDNHIVAHSAEGATATVDLTLVLPPATLPQFRWDGRQR